MAHSVVDPGARPDYEVVQFLADGGSVIDEFPLIRAGGHKFERNRRGFQAHGNDTQAASGDGRRIVGERTIDLLVETSGGTTREARLNQLDEALELATSFRYDGATFTIAGSRGITAMQPLGLTAYRATIGYIPTEATGTAGGATVLGPL